MAGLSGVGVTLAALLTAAFTALATTAFRLEYAAASFVHRPAEQQLRSLARGTMSLPLSLRAQRQVLAACEAALRSPLGRFQPQQQFDALTAACDGLASVALARAPGDSQALLLRGAVALLRARTGEFVTAMHLSQATGAQEGWLAQRRLVWLAEPGAPLAPGLQAGLAADVQLLSGTAEGRALLAESYLLHPDLRATIDVAPAVPQR